MQTDDLEPFVGTYDWAASSAQNPELPVFTPTAEQRRRIHGVQIIRPRRAASTDWFMTV